jgi:hypothetical protein
VASAYGRIGRTAPLLAAVAEEAVHRAGLAQFKPSEIAMLLWVGLYRFNPVYP